MYLPRTQLAASRRYLPSAQQPQQQQVNPLSFLQQPQQQQGGGLNDMFNNVSQVMDYYNQYQDWFGGGDSSITSMFGGGEGTSSEGLLGGMGWWAALAAAIVGNEEEARKRGRRDEDSTSRFVDQLSGAVLEQDMDYYGDKIGGFGGEIVKTAGQMGNPEGVWKMIKDLF